MKRGTILIAEDDRSVLAALADTLEDAGYTVHRAASGKEALRMLSDAIDLLITDLWMPLMDGLALLVQARERHADLQAIIITGNATVPSAVQAMKAGAFDYLTKPFTPPDLLDAVERALEQRRISRDIASWSAHDTTGDGLAAMMGQSPKMHEVYGTIHRVAPFKSTVLVEGESGTGKEMVVRAIHELSPRKDAPFVAINCAAVPAGLMESELFGHERGAFTGASSKTLGYFEAANRGTLFIDEVGELDLSLQAKLLRVLETGRLIPVGSTRERAVDTRVIAATNANLQQAVDEKRFRSDLFYRLNVVRITLPPLRDRMDDLPLLVGSLLARLAQELGVVVPAVDPGAIQAMQRYNWPGNVRELRNMLESLLILHAKPTITVADLPEHVRTPRADNAAMPIDLDHAERDVIVRALEQTHGDRTQAAQLLSVSIRTLYRKMARYGLR